MNSVDSWITEASKSEPARIPEVPSETSETLLLKEGRQFHQNIYLGCLHRMKPGPITSYQFLFSSQETGSHFPNIESHAPGTTMSKSWNVDRAASTVWQGALSSFLIFAGNGWAVSGRGKVNLLLPTLKTMQVIFLTLSVILIKSKNINKKTFVFWSIPWQITSSMIFHGSFINILEKKTWLWGRLACLRTNKMHTAY